MRILFTGTCACDYSPLLNTTCKDRLDNDARRSSCILINGHILVDCGDHTVDSLRIQSIDFKSIDTICITHLHSDHYRPESIKLIQESNPDIKVYVREGSEEAVRANGIANVCGLTPLKKVDIAENMSVLPLAANHTYNPLHFLFEESKAQSVKKLFYGCDGAWLLFDTYYALRNQNIDMMIFDCTVGDYEGDFRMAEHNSIPMLRLMLPSLKTFNVYRESAKLYASHIAPSLHKSHEETCGILAKDGILVAYDGLEVTI